MSMMSVCCSRKGRNKKIHRAESQDEENKAWWRKLKLDKLKERLNHINS